MTLDDQLKEFLLAPLRLCWLRLRGLLLLLLYFMLSAGLLGAVVLLVVKHRQELRDLLLSYLLPEGWQLAGQMLLERLITGQAREVLINATSGTALALVALCLFRVKELVSRAVERERSLAEPGQELPLLTQVLEELKLALLFGGFFCVSFWVGYQPEPFLRRLAVVLSHLFLCLSFSIIFISPILQRRPHYYSTCIKVLLKHPILTLLFGAFFAAPGVLAGYWLKRHSEWSMQQAVLLLFAVNVLAIGWAAVAGTWVGARLLPAAARTPRSSWPVRWLGWLVLLAILGGSAAVFGLLARTLHHKSQILKCDYRVDLKTLKFEWPRLSAILLSGRVEVGAAIDVTITNPTPYPVQIEDNRVVFAHGTTVVGETRLSPLSVAAGATARQRVALKLALNAAVLIKGRQLLQNHWAITLYLRLTPRFEFPIYLLRPKLPPAP